MSQIISGFANYEARKRVPINAARRIFRYKDYLQPRYVSRLFPEFHDLSLPFT